MQFLTAVDDETRSGLVATPVLSSGAIDRRGIAWTPSGSISERSMEIDGGKPRRGRLACLSLCASSTLSNASGPSGGFERVEKRSMVDVSKMKHT